MFERFGWHVRGKKGYGISKDERQKSHRLKLIWKSELYYYIYYYIQICNFKTTKTQQRKSRETSNIKIRAFLEVLGKERKRRKNSVTEERKKRPLSQRFETSSKLFLEAYVCIYNILEDNFDGASGLGSRGSQTYPF